jgi:hypothetical protein
VRDGRIRCRPLPDGDVIHCGGYIFAIPPVSAFPLVQLMAILDWPWLYSTPISHKIAREGLTWPLRSSRAVRPDGHKAAPGELAAHASCRHAVIAYPPSRELSTAASDQTACERRPSLLPPRCFPEAIFSAGGHAMSACLRWPMEGEECQRCLHQNDRPHRSCAYRGFVAQRLESIFLRLLQ